MKRSASGASTRASRRAGRRKPKVYKFSETYSNEPIEEAVQMYNFFDSLPEKLRLFLKSANYQWDPADLLMALVANSDVDALINSLTQEEQRIVENVYRALRT